MKNLVTLLTGFFLSLHPLFSQNISLGVANYTVHSPNVTSLGQYGEYPVDASTGVPAIDIPLYTIKGSKLELPLSLSYHASGIKVDQEASFVGLGWVLNAGGVVTRVIRDRPDEHNRGFLETGGNLQDFNQIGVMQEPSLAGNSDYLEWTYDNKVDKEPDLFSANAPGLSGEFCLDNSLQFVGINLQPWQYEVDWSKKTIVIKDNKGNIFRFGRSLDNEEAYEITSMQTSALNSESSTGFNPNTPVHSPYTSSFYLTEMISADLSDTIKFKYRTFWYSDTKIASMTRYILNTGYFLNTVDGSGRSFDGTIKTYLSTDITNARVIDEIQFKNGSVKFSRSHDRADARGGTEQHLRVPRITGLTVFDRGGRQIRKMIFDNNAYFDRPGAEGLDGMPVAEYKKRSLKLNAVKFYDSGNNFINDYRFSYDPTPLPPRNTSPQDLWGYYNGKFNETLIPESFFTTATTGRPVFVGESRESDGNFMKAAVLNKVTFPTGGYTIYDYEPHYYLNKMQRESRTERQRNESTYAVNRLASCPEEFLYGVPANNVREFEVTEELGNNDLAVADIYVMFSDCQVLKDSQRMTFRITNLSTGTSFSSEHHPTGTNKTANFQMTIRKGNRIRVEANTNGATGSNMSPCNSPYIQVGFNYTYWEVTTEEEITPKQAGGLRVKSITSFDANGTTLSKKAYEYGDTKYGREQVGVGVLITDPSKNFYNYPLLYAHHTDQDLQNVLWFTSDSQVELGLNRGCPVYYPKVTERVISHDSSVSNGKTEYLYQQPNGYHEPKASLMYPYDFVIYPSWKNNNLDKVTHYRLESNGDYTPVKSIEYRYDETPEALVKTLKIIEAQPDTWYATKREQMGSWLYFEDNLNRFIYYNFYIPRGRILKSKETITDFDIWENKVVMEKQFTYNSNYDLNRESFMNSKGEPVEKRYKYTGELGYEDLISKNMVSLPAQEEHLIKGRVRGGVVLKYNSFGEVSEQYALHAAEPQAPVAYENYASVPRYYERRKELVYDPLSKSLREVKQDNSFSTSYLWAYGGQHPIAMIHNAGYASVENALGSANIEFFRKKANLTDEEIRQFVSTLRQALPNAQVTVYTYDPLVGLTSQTDPNGKITYYKYDGLGRLKTVKDQEGNVVKSYEYHYAGQ